MLMTISSPASFKGKNKTTEIKCGCGLYFKDMRLFKEHSLFVHNGQFQNGSTHFLTKFTLIVLPFSRGKQDDSRMQNHPKIQKNSNGTQSTKVNNNMKSQKVHIDKRNSSKPQTLVLKKEKKEIKQFKPIEWNGFRLAINNASMAQGYFCGNCQINFTQPQAFIIHCIEVCQQLKNQHSSHFIGCIYDKEKSVNLSKQIKSKGNPIIPIKQKGKPGRKRLFPIAENQVFQQIFRKNLDHKKLPFKCTLCNLTFFDFNQYRNHINRVHSQIIDPSCSHIILRTHKKLNLYISRHVEWINEDVKYFCHCKPQKKMTMAKLIQHTFEIHKGISPRYK